LKTLNALINDCRKREREKRREKETEKAKEKPSEERLIELLFIKFLGKGCLIAKTTATATSQQQQQQHHSPLILHSQLSTHTTITLTSSQRGNGNNLS